MRARNSTIVAIAVLVCLIITGCGNTSDDEASSTSGSSATPPQGQIVGALLRVDRDTVSVSDSQVTLRTDLHAGDQVNTRDGGQGEFETDDRITCTVADGSTVLIHPTDQYAQSWTHGHGDCWLPDKKPKVSIKIETPKPFDIAMTGDLVFGLDVSDDRTLIAVYSGILIVEALGQTQVVGPNLEVVAEAGEIKASPFDRSSDPTFSGDTDVITRYLQEQETPELSASAIRDESPAMSRVFNKGTADVCILGNDQYKVMGERALQTLFSKWFPGGEVSAVEQCPNSISETSLFSDFQIAFVVGPNSQLAGLTRVTLFDAPRPLDLTHVVPPGVDAWSVAFRSGDDSLAQFVRDSVFFAFLGNGDDDGYTKLYQGLFAGIPAFEGLGELAKAGQ